MTLEKPCNGRFIVERGQKLDSTLCFSEEANPDPFGVDVLFFRGGRTEERSPAFARLSQRVDRDSDVIDYGHLEGRFVVVHAIGVDGSRNRRACTLENVFTRGNWSQRADAGTSRPDAERTGREHSMEEMGAAGTHEITDANFAHEIESAEGLSMVDFWAEWCGPCRLVGPVVEELAADYSDRIKVGKMDVDSNPETAMRFNVRSIPSILFFKDGELVDTVVGALPKSALEAKILEHV